MQTALKVATPKTKSGKTFCAFCLGLMDYENCQTDLFINNLTTANIMYFSIY